MIRTVFLSLALLVSPLAIAGSPPVIKLIRSGNGPKRVLRYQPKAGTVDQMQMTMTMAMAMRMGDNQMPAMKMPPMQMTFSTTVTEVHSNGDFDSEMLLKKATVPEAGEAPQAMVERIRESLAPMVGLRLRSRTSSRGFLVSSKVDSPNELPPEMQSTIDSLKQSAEQMAQPLPKEAVGVGAMWTVTQRITQNGMTIQQVSTVELVSLKGDTVKTTTTLKQSAKAQAVKLPGMPAGVAASLESLQGSGSAKGHLELSRVVPLSNSAKAKTTVNMSLSQGSENLGMSMDMTIDMSAQRL